MENFLRLFGITVAGAAGANVGWHAQHTLGLVLKRAACCRSAVSPKASARRSPRDCESPEWMLRAAGPCQVDVAISATPRRSRARSDLAL